jgi:ABC-type transporter Mla MlaB component
VAAFEQTPEHRRRARRRPLREPRTLTFTVRGPITRADLSGLTNRLERSLTAGEPDVLICDLAVSIGSVTETVDALARLQLTARRSGAQLTIRDASTQLQELLGFVGLDEVVELCV